MFNNRYVPITPAQSAYLGRLITRHGKERYQQAKQKVGIPADTTLLKLSKAQAARLIRELITSRKARK